MELRARTIAHKTREERGGEKAVPAETAATVAPVREAPREGPQHSITLRYDALLYDTLHNMIRSSHTAQDFTYASLADFIRAALNAYKNGMVLTEIDRGGAKLETSLRVDRELWLFYKALPSRMRSKIVERAIRSFLKQSIAEAGAHPQRTGDHHESPS